MRVLSGLLIAGALAGCQEPPTQQQTLATSGVTEITITGITTSSPSATARWIPTSTDVAAPNRSVSGVAMSPMAVRTLTPLSTVAPLDGSIKLDPVSVSTFTAGPRPGGSRYVAATYRVRNATQAGDAYPTARTNLTFVAISDGLGLNGSAIQSLLKFDGSATAFSAIQVLPTGSAAMDRSSGTLTTSTSDIFQAYTETEVASAGNSALLPYGFVVRNATSSSSRTLAADPGANQFDGLVTFAFKYPLQASATDDAFTIVARFLAVDDNETWVVQSAEDTTSSAQANVTSRATALGASLRSIVSATVNGSPADQRCAIRTAGPNGAATATVGC